MVLILPSTFAGNCAPEPVSSSTLLIEGVVKHPVMEMTPEDVELGRHNYATKKWAKPVGDAVTSDAAIWLTRDENWIKNHIPAPAACFAYGFAGCPECGGKTGAWSASICSFDNPGHVKCVNGHTLPNSKYPDSGDGFHGPDGRMHYLVGTYNSWAVEEFQNGAFNLAYAYSLTGDEKYASRCAEILDALADIYPTCVIGSWDYPEVRKGENVGRFNRPKYQVGRVIINLSNAYDQIFHSPSLQKASARKGMTRQKNIEYNMLLNGADFCYNQSFNFTGLTNGSADYIKGAMVVGLVLGIPEYVKWGVDGPYGIRAMLSNNVGRDGTYYETATGYSYYTRSIYRGFAEYLLNYRGSAYPDGVNLYENSRFLDYMLLHNLRTQVGGMIPNYGDFAPYGSPENVSDRLYEKFDFDCLGFLLERCDAPETKKKYSDLMAWVTDGKPDDVYARSPSSRWFLFHRKPNNELNRVSDGGTLAKEICKSDIMGQKGMVMLRSGTGRNAHGLFLRYGPSLNHANFDGLNFSYYAMGHDLTYDLGYALASAHVYSGWSKQTASHQLVVVDRNSQGDGQNTSGGSLDAFWQGKHTSGVRASDPGIYNNLGVKEYERTLMLVGDPESTAVYALDVFRVAGGKQHDSFTHSLGTDVTFGNVNRGEVTSSSIAGGENVWGDKILVDGDVAGQPNKPYWIAPPGNGYGFLVEPQKLTPTSSSWWADWKIPESTDHVRVTFAAVNQEEDLTAWGPGIAKNLPNAQYVIRRRDADDGENVFVNLWEPYADKPVVSGFEVVPLERESNTSGGLAVKVNRTDGRVDYLYCGQGDTVTKGRGLTVTRQFARITENHGRIKVAEGLALNELKFRNKNVLESNAPSHLSGSVSKVDIDGGVVDTTVKIPADLKLEGLVITFNNTGYSRNTAYKVGSVDRFSTGSTIHLTENCNLGRGIVSSIDETSCAITTLVSHEYAKAVSRLGDSGFFRGKRIRNLSGGSTNVKRMGISQPMTLYVEKIEGFAVGDTFVYEDLQAGDSWDILLPVEIMTDTK